jgi:hypothetical protein
LQSYFKQVRLRNYRGAKLLFYKQVKPKKHKKSQNYKKSGLGKKSMINKLRPPKNKPELVLKMKIKDF